MSMMTRVVIVYFLRQLLANAAIAVSRIFCLDAVGPQGRPWMGASGHNGDTRGAAHGYEPTREAAMAAFAKSWRRSWGFGSLARSSSSPWLRTVASGCPICPMSINLTPYRIRGIAHSRHRCGKLILAATEDFRPIANLVLVVHADA
jgi:hypothetical protein